MVEATALSIRYADEGDLNALEWEGEYRHYRRVYRRAMLEMKQGRRIIFVAEIGPQMVGQIFVQLYLLRAELRRGVSSGYLHALRVRPFYRNQGIGTRLIIKAETALLERRFVRAVISAAKDNPHARRLYERLGYRKFTSDPGQWSYVDHRGRLRNVHEPSDILEKWLES